MPRGKRSLVTNGVEQLGILTPISHHIQINTWTTHLKISVKIIKHKGVSLTPGGTKIFIKDTINHKKHKFIS